MAQAKRKEDISGRYHFSDDHPYFCEKLYIPLEDLDGQWIWTEADINQFDMLWKNGMPIDKMAKYFDVYDTTILVVWLDRYIKGELGVREGWNLW